MILKNLVLEKILSLIPSFLSIQLINKLLYPFHLTYNLSPFLLMTFTILNSFWFFFFFFLQLLFKKRSSNSFFVKIINNICPRHSIFYLFNHKNFFRPIWNINFCRNTFVFWYSNNITDFKFRIFIIILFIRVNVCAWFYINGFHLNCAMICSITFINYIIEFININIFWYWSHLLINFIY